MRTKALLLASALSSVGLTAALGQVFSQNIVGYVTVSAPKGLTIVANQLDNKTGNKISDVIPAVPNGTVVLKYSSSGFTANTFLDGWDDGTMTLNPGEAAFVQNVGNTAISLTFVGEVKLGESTVSLAKGLSLVSAVVPQALAVKNLGLPTFNGDVLFQFTNAGGYKPNTYLDGFDTPDDIVAVGEGFFYFNNEAAAKDWKRTFTVN